MKTSEGNLHRMQTIRLIYSTDILFLGLNLLFISYVIVRYLILNKALRLKWAVFFYGFATLHTMVRLVTGIVILHHAHGYMASSPFHEDERVNLCNVLSLASNMLVYSYCCLFLHSLISKLQLIFHYYESSLI